MASKDPAFLFYPNDWTGGTGILSRHLKGCYMDLLIAQFNHGHLSLEEIRTVLGTDFPAWNTLQKKFAQDATGKFFNERLETEILKRREFSKKQKDRIEKRWNKTPQSQFGNTAVLPKENESGNRNGIGNEIQGGAGGIPLEPSQHMVEEAFTQYGLTAKEGAEFYSWVKGKHGWKNIHSWTDYVAATISKKLDEKNSKNGHHKFGSKINLADLDQSANEFLKKSGLGRTGS